MRTQLPNLSVFGREVDIPMSLPIDPEVLLKPIGDKPKIPPVQFGTREGASVEILDQIISLSANVEANIDFLGKKEQEQLETEFSGLEIDPQDDPISRFRFAAGIGLGLDTKIPLSWVALKLKAKAAASLEYQHLARQSATLPAVKAVPDLITGSKFPLTLRPKRLSPEEAHLLKGRFEIDMGLSGQVSKNFGNTLGNLNRLLDQDSQVSFDVSATLSASIGFSYLDAFEILVSTFGQDKNWARLRVKRVNQSKFSFGVNLGLLMKYDFSAPFQSLLSEVMELDAVTNFQSMLEQVLDNEDLKAIANGDWATIKDKLGNELAEELDNLIGLQGLLAKVDYQVTPFLREVQKVVDFFENLDEEVKSLWKVLLEDLNLGDSCTIVDILKQIAALKDKTPDQIIAELLKHDFKKALELFETLSGISLEELLTSFNLGSLNNEIKKAAELAQKALDFRTKFPEQALDYWNKTPQASYLKNVMKWLSENATSLEKLEAFGNAQIKNLAEKITGKAFDQIDDKALAQIQDVASTIRDTLSDDLNLKKIEDRLKEEFNSWKGEIGFALAFEMDRVARRESLIDVEFDTRSIKEPWNEIATLNLKGFVSRLLKRKFGEDGAPNYRFNEVLFQSKVIRTSTWSAVARLFGVKVSNSVTRVRTAERKITLKNGDLVGEFAASLSQKIVEKKDSVWSTGLSLIQNASVELERDMFVIEDVNRTHFQLTMSREDAKTDQTELDALKSWTQFFGFDVGTALDVPTGTSTRIGIMLRSSNAATNRFIQSEFPSDPNLLKRQWRDYFKDAAIPWLRDKLVTDHQEGQQYLGDFLADYFGKEKYLSVYFGSLEDIRDLNRGKWPQGIKPRKKDYEKILFSIPWRSLRRPKKLAVVNNRLRNVENTTVKDNHRNLREYAFQLSQLSPRFWSSPMFLMIVFFKALKVYEGKESALKGALTIQTKAAGKSEWSDPTVINTTIW